MTRSEMREKVVTIIYQIFMYDKNKMEYQIDDVINSLVSEKTEYINTLVYGINENIEALKEIANKNLNKWSIDRLSSLDASILITGIYELLYTDTPDIVAINEAIELSKKYSDEKVTKMINGVLDKIRIDHEQ